MSDTLLNTNQINMGDITGAYFEMTKDMSDGKKTIAQALTSKGTPASDTELLSTLAQKVTALNTENNILYGRAASASPVSNSSTMVALQIPTKGLVCYANGLLYFIEQYSEFNNFTNIYESAKFSTNLETLLGESVSATWQMASSHNGRYLVIVKNTFCWLIEITSSSFVFIAKYTLPHSSSYTNFPIAISNSGEVLLYSTTDYWSGVYLHVLGSATDVACGNASYSVSSSSVILLEDNNTYTVAIANSVQSQQYVFYSKITRSDTTLTRTSADYAMYGQSTTSDLGPYYPIVVDDTQACMVNFSKNKLFLISTASKDAFINSARWQKVDLGDVFPWANLTYAWSNMPAIIKEVDTSTGIATLDSPLWSKTVDIDVNNLTIENGLGDSIQLMSVSQLNSNSGPTVSFYGTSGYPLQVLLIGKDKASAFIRYTTSARIGGNTIYDFYYTSTTRSYYIASFRDSDIVYGYKVYLGGSPVKFMKYAFSFTETNSGIYDYDV